MVIKSATRFLLLFSMLLGSGIGWAQTATTTSVLTLPTTSQTVLDLVDEIYANLFGTGGGLREAQGYIYNYYAFSGIYVGFKNSRVYVVGGPFGDRILDKGPATNVVTALNVAKSKIQNGTSTAVATLANVKAQLCSEESALKSLNGAAANLRVVNNTSENIKFYWLNSIGLRVLYQTIKPGATYTQGTFVNHPWVITNAQDKCVGIYTTTGVTNPSLTINKI